MVPFDLFTGKKPSKYELLDGEKNITNWADILKSVCEELYSLDSDLFKEMKKDNPKWGLFSGSNRSFIVGDMNLKIGWSTWDCLTFILKMLKYYDEHLDLTLENDFWFELKDDFEESDSVKVNEN